MARQRERATGGPQGRQIYGRDIERGPPKAARQDGRNADGRGLEPGAWNPNGTRPNFRPERCKEAAAMRDPEVHNVRAIPNCYIKLYKSIDNYRK